MDYRARGQTGVALFVALLACILRSGQCSDHADVTWPYSLLHLNCRGTSGDFNLIRIVTDHHGSKEGSHLIIQVPAEMPDYLAIQL
jgi:hypothetical protein